MYAPYMYNNGAIDKKGKLSMDQVRFIKQSNTSTLPYGLLVQHQAGAGDRAATHEVLPRVGSAAGCSYGGVGAVALRSLYGNGAIFTNTLQ